jgi:hypothetical protein
VVEERPKGQGMDDWDNLSDDELEDRLAQRGVDRDDAERLVDNRDDRRAARRILEALG